MLKRLAVDPEYILETPSMGNSTLQGLCTHTYAHTHTPNANSL